MVWSQASETLAFREMSCMSGSLCFPLFDMTMGVYVVKQGEPSCKLQALVDNDPVNAGSSAVTSVPLRAGCRQWGGCVRWEPGVYGNSVPPPNFAVNLKLL